MAILDVFKKKKEVKVKEEKDAKIIHVIEGEIAKGKQDVVERNDYITYRHEIVYGDKMMEEANLPKDFDMTDFNFAPRILDIHTSQLMGKGFFIGTNYDKIDTSIIEDQRMDKTSGQMLENPEKKEAFLTNEARKAKAQAVKKLVDAIIKDNGGYSLFKDGSRIGSAYGTTVMKYWVEKENGQVKPKIKLIEKLKNYYAIWKQDDFRERSADVFRYKMELDEANRRYAEFLGKDESFSADVITEDNTEDETIPMCTITDYTGVHPLGLKKDGEPIIVNILYIGNKVIQSINMDGSEPAKVPGYILVRNKIELGEAWGLSDLSAQFISQNIGYIERMSEETTKVQKFHFPIGLAIGYNQATIPKKNKRETTIIPANPGQDIKFVQPPVVSYEYPKIMDELKEAMAKSSGVGRIMFENPQINYDSAEALMMGMKSILDVVEEKQDRWTPELIKMFSDLIYKMRQLDRAVREAIPEDIEIYIEWPSVLRKESAAYRTMLLNDLQRGAMSLETYLEKTGVQDPSEELDRIRTEATDDVIGPIVFPQAYQMMKAQDMQDKQEDMMEAQQAQMGMQPEMEQGGEGLPGVGSQPNPTLTPGQNQENAQPLPQRGQMPTATPEGAIAQKNFVG